MTAHRCLQPQVTLSPVRRGEGRGEGSAGESERLTLAGAPHHPTHTPPRQGGGGIGGGGGRSAALLVGIRQSARLPTWLPAIVWVLALACEPRSPAGDAPSGRADSPHRTAAEDYVLVGANGAVAFDGPPASPTSAAGVRLGKGFGFLATGETRNVGGRRYVRIHDGRWLLDDGEISHVRPSRFAGARLAPGESLRFGWVVARAATVYAAADAGSAAVITRPRLTRLALAGPCRKGFCPLVVGWVRAQDLSLPTVAARPV